MPAVLKKNEFDFNSLPDQKDQGIDFSSLPDQIDQQIDFSSLPDKSESTPSLASKAIDALKFINPTKTSPIPDLSPDYVGNKTYDANASPVDRFLKEKLITKPAEAAPVVRQFLTDKLAGSLSHPAGTPEVPATEENLLAKAQQTGKVPYGDIINRVLAETIPEMIPLTPTEIATYAVLGKATDVGIAKLGEIPLFRKSISQIPKVIQEWVMTKPKTIEVGEQALRDFYVFGKEKLDPQTYEFLQSLPKENIVDMIKARQGTSFETRVPRFGGVPEPAVPSLKPGIPQESANLPAVPGIPEPKPILSQKGSEFLQNNHPVLAKAVDTLPPTVDPEILKKTIVDATTQANIATINGASPQEAQAAALKHFGDKIQSGELAPKIALQKAVKFDVEGIPIKKPAAVVTSVDLGGGQKVDITHGQVVNEAKALQQDALNSREISPLEQFVKRNGGVKGYKGSVEGEEFKGVPIHLRGTQAVDEMAQMAYHRGLLEEPSGDLLREKLKKIKARGPEPKLGEFYDQAARNLEYYAQEGVQMPTQPENVPIGTIQNLERARNAANEVLRTNKIDDQVLVKIVDQIAVDDQAFKKGYGQPYKPSEFEIQGATYTPGMKDRIKSVIELANGADRGVGRHEAFHAVSNILLDEAEQKIITDRFGDMEKAADAFAEYRSTGKAETPFLERIFQKIKDFLDRIKNYFDSKKFKTADDLFKDIEEGKLKGAGTGKGGPQYKAAEVMDLQDKALSEFGETKDFEKAGFIFPDGKMVDFTKGGKDRIFMHQDIAGVYKGTGVMDDPYSLLQKFMEDTNAVRLSQYDDISGHHVSVEAHGPLSQDQIREIGEYYDTHPMDMTTFEVMNSIGRSVRSTAVKDPTSEDVARFFNGSSQYKVVENKPPFFSMVEKTINDKMPARAPGDQVMGLLRNSPGIKQEEMDWIGLPEFLKDKTSVTKEEVQNFIKENNVHVQEVMKGTGEQAPGIINPKEQTKFEKYTLPGGENYRELLLTLPKQQETHISFDQWYDQTHVSPYSELSPKAQEIVRSDYEREGQNVENVNDFRSSHFPEPNILAHIRFNDRVDAEGKKTLFIEEVQSDWHQQGREHGYKDSQAEADRVAKLKALDEQRPGSLTKWAKNNGRDLSDPKTQNDWNDARDKWQEEVDALKENRNTVSNAPFKKTWHELALKRILRFAAENGYDSLSWTTGEQQAERYDLSKQVDSISATKAKDNGLFNVTAYNGGTAVLKEIDVTPEKLSGLIGKDLAEKISQQPAGQQHSYSGQDLKVGGEGMKGFYDQIIPSFLNKYAKKWGGRVGETKINTGTILDMETDLLWRDKSGKIKSNIKTVNSLDITPSMKESVMREGQPLYKAIQKDSAMDLKQSATEIRDLVNPTKAAPLAAAITREQLGKMARSFDKAEAALGKAHTLFEGQSVANNIDFIDKMERGQPQANPELQGIAMQLRDLLDSKRSEVQALGSGKLKNFIENYFPHIWDQSEGKVSKAMQVGAKRPFEGRKSFLKQRKIEYFKDGIELGLTPASYNPIDLTFLKIREMDKYIMAHQTLNEFKEEGLAQFVKLGKDVPEGWQKINDNISTVMRPITSAEGKMEGLAIVGHYYAQPDAARIINNYLSPGLQKSSVYRAYRYLGNAINQFQLGLSAFHLGFTSVDSMVSKFALALNKLALGHPIGAVKTALQTPFAPIENIIRGDKLLKAWKGTGNTTDEIIAQAMASGGGRARMDQFYSTNAAQQMKKLFQSGKYIQGIFKAPFAAIEASSKPILEYIVPRQKLGIFSDIMKMELEHNPNMSHEELRSIAQKAWDSVDNRMGQLVYDNLFWNRTFKDLLMASVRSVGWNLGTIREVGGGIGDLGQLGKGPKGRGANLSYRTAYLAALPIIAGTLGAIYQYLRTGKGPQELKDYYFPRTGAMDENGDPVRVSIPSYMKDLYHYTQHPVTTVTNKLSPLIGMTVQMLNNKDYFGVKIHNEDDPLVRQMADEAEYILKQMIPFGIRNAQRNMQNNKQLRDIVEPFIGITPAPYDINQTKAETLAHRISAQKMPIGGRTKEDADRSKLLRDFSKRLKLNDPTVRTDMFQAIRDRQVTPLQIAKINRESHLTPLQRQVHSFSAAEIKKVYDIATPEEKKQIENMMKAKIARSKHLVEQP